MSERVYISIRPNTKETLILCQQIATFCINCGLEVSAPYLAGDSDKPNPSKGEVVEARDHPMRFSDLVIVHLGIADLEMYADLRAATENNTPVIILCANRGLVKIDAFKNMNISSVVEFSNNEEAFAQFERALLRWQWDHVVGQNHVGEKNLIHTNHVAIRK